MEVVRDHPAVDASANQFRNAKKNEQPPDEWTTNQQKLF
jgi:hypothetical protein